MANRRILTTDNTTDIIGSDGGICRTMVLTWISESLKGVRMRDMGSVLTGSGQALISARHKALKIRMNNARNLGDQDAPEQTATDFSAGFNLKHSADSIDVATALVGATLDPANLTTDPAYALITITGQNRAHALGLALNISGKHYFLDPNTGLYEGDALADICGMLGLLALHLTANYVANYPLALIELLEPAD